MKHMNPIMEAKELILKFREFANGTDDNDDRFSPAIEKENAKQCALIAVNEIIEATKYELSHAKAYLDGRDSEIITEVYYSPYWQEVKQEVEKL